MPWLPAWKRAVPAAARALGLPFATSCSPHTQQRPGACSPRLASLVRLALLTREAGVAVSRRFRARRPTTSTAIFSSYFYNLCFLCLGAGTVLPQTFLNLDDIIQTYFAFTLLSNKRAGEDLLWSRDAPSGRRRGRRDGRPAVSQELSYRVMFLS